MVKTTVLLDDEVYKNLVKEALERYGSTRKLSLLINEKLRGNEPPATAAVRRRRTVKLGRKLTERELEETIERTWGELTAWKA